MIQKKVMPGRAIKCPDCGAEIRYSWLSGMSGPHLHLYANDSNDVIFRGEWWNEVQMLLTKNESDENIIYKIRSLLATVSEFAACRYSIKNNVRCTHCKFEFPYRFKNNLKMRIEDQSVVLIDNCKIDSDFGIFLIEVTAV